MTRPAYILGGIPCGYGDKNGTQLGALLNYWYLLFSEPSDGDQVVFEAEEGNIIFEIETEDR